MFRTLWSVKLLALKGILRKLSKMVTLILNDLPSDVKRQA